MSGKIIPLSAVTVTDALAANDGGSAFTLTGNPLLGPQPLSVLFAAGWDGGNVTITGTAVNPKDPRAADGTPKLVARVEVITPPASLPAIVETSWPFGTVSAVAKSAVGAGIATAQVKTLYPTQAPQLVGFRQNGIESDSIGGNVYGAMPLHANTLILEGAVTSGTIELQPIFYENGRWWPLTTASAVSIVDTMLGKSNIGRFLTAADPSTIYHVWLTNTGTFDVAYLYGKNGPSIP